MSPWPFDCHTVTPVFSCVQDSNQYYSHQQDYSEYYNQGYGDGGAGYWDEHGNSYSTDPYSQDASQAQSYDTASGWSATHASPSPSKAVGFSAGEGAEPSDEAQDFMAALEAAVASHDSSEAAAKKRAEEEAKADAEAAAARERLEAAEAKRQRRDKRKKEKWDTLSESERRRIEALRSKNRKHKEKLEMEERVQEAKVRRPSVHCFVTFHVVYCRFDVRDSVALVAPVMSSPAGQSGGQHVEATVSAVFGA
jgi:hypothetical protein